MKRFLLARHGETEWNREGRIQGWSQVSLNDVGRRQARALGEFLAETYPNVEAIHASDLPRAVETVSLLREASGWGDVPVTYDRAWRERDFGVYQGLASEKFFEEHPEFALLERGQEAAAAVPECGESYLAFRERVLEAWATLTETNHDVVLLVAHGGVLRTILGSILGLGLREALQTLSHENTGMAEVEYDCTTGEAAIVHRHRADHLAAVGRPEGRTT
ncbi:MAG: histidine phosphatase family protein [Halobacteriaceae archaeon]